jgi:septal ring factor EnvC (AmiA/AmiB activator)
MLKRPLESTDAGGRRYSAESLDEIRGGLQQQLDALDARIDAVRRELKEAQTVRAELRRDLDYVEARIAGTPADQLLDARRNARAASKAKRAKSGGA